MDPLFQEENRKKILDEYQGKKSASLIRLMTAYDRYSEAISIGGTLKDAIVALRILDYGCGVGDYGIYFARRGAMVTFYDFEMMLNFAKYRMEKERLFGCYRDVKDGELDFSMFDLIIFGEVLEHLEHPLKIIYQCKDEKVRYLFTTAYPYVTDMEYFKHKGHSESAGRQQYVVRNFLENNYYKIAHYTGGQYLWLLKESYDESTPSN